MCQSPDGLYLIGFFQGKAADFDLDYGTDVFVGRAEDTLVVDIEHGGVAVVVYGLLPFDESPAFAEAGAAFEVHVRGCRQFEYALEYGCHSPVLFD